MSKQLYSGPRAISNYLQPDRENYSPLVELPPELNPYYESHDIHIYIKLLNTLPLSNVKSLPAWSMLSHAQDNIVGKNVVESSSGNTVFSMGILANSFGVTKVKAVASRDVTPGKLNLLRIAGIDVQLVDGPLCPSPDDPKSSIAIARKIGKDKNWYNPGQYDNDFNPQAHREYTGPQLYNQLNGSVDMFVAGLGTTGTLVGTAEYLKQHNKDIHVVGVVRVPNNAVPGVRTKNGLNEVSFGWKNAITDELVAINEHESFAKSLAMIQYGLLVGPSAGFAYAGVLKQLETMQQSSALEAFRGKNVVFVAPDSMFPYIDEYLAVLDDSYFGKIDDQTTSNYREASDAIAGVAELSVDDIYRDYVEKDKELTTQHYQLVDVRDAFEFEDHHLPSSVRVPFDELEQWLEHTEKERQKPLVFICRRGAISLRAAQLASQRGAEAYSMVGGTTEWSARGLPRIVSNYC